MLRSKSFVKVTKKGSVVNVVKEHYLRDDIGCHIESCTSCAPPSTGSSLARHASASISSLFTTAHYLVPDTNIFLHQMDVVERGPFHNVIVLQTVLEEVKHHNMHIYKRLRALIGSPDRAFIVFSNENHRDTFIERDKGESPNDRNDRAIRVATRWYNAHILASLPPLASTTTKPVAVYLTDDAGSRALARQESTDLKAISLKGYIESLTTGSAELLNMLSAAVALEREATTTETTILYPEYLPTSQLESGIQTSAFLRGILNVNPLNTNQGSVMLTGSDGTLESILVHGRRNMNRAMQGDTVVLQLLPKSKWRSSLQDTLLGDDSDSLDCENESESELDESGTRPIATTTNAPETGTKKAARVVGLLSRNKRHYTGSLETEPAVGLSDQHPPEWLLFRPMDRRVPAIQLRMRSGTATLQGTRFVIAVDDWPVHSKRPLGHFVRSIGPIDDADAAALSLLIEYDVPGIEPFPQAALNALPPSDWTAQPDPSRVDYRPLFSITCSVDPPGCTDIDDALHALRLPSGNYQVGVHIADVSAFVVPGSALDTAAALRATSVYLSDRRIDMLPPLLGSKLCSLHAQVDRYTFTVLWEMDTEARIVSTTFHKSIIRSAASLTYSMAQKRLFDSQDHEPLTESLRILSSLAQRLRAERMRHGALNLASLNMASPFADALETSEEIRGESPAMEQASPTPDSEDVEAHSLVEEFMLLANVSVATYLARQLPSTCLLRIHPAPTPGSFDGLQAALASRGLARLQTHDSLALGASLESAAKDLAAATTIMSPSRSLSLSPAVASTLLRVLTTRALRTAQYAPATPGANVRHYGLAADLYTHFTSPIRRYADLIVHRLLAEAMGASRSQLSEPNESEDSMPPLELESKLYTRTSLETLCVNMNHRHKMAQLVSRHSAQASFLASIQDRTLTGRAHVLRTLANGLIILFYDYGIEGSLAFDRRAIKKHANTLCYDPKQMAWIHKPDNEPLVRVFDALQVSARASRVGSEHRLTFEWIDAPQPIQCLLKSTKGVKRKERVDDK